MGIEQERTKAASKAMNLFVKELRKRFGLKPIRGGTPTQRKKAVMKRLGKKLGEPKGKGHKLRGE